MNDNLSLQYLYLDLIVSISHNNLSETMTAVQNITALNFDQQLEIINEIDNEQVKLLFNNNSGIYAIENLPFEKRRKKIYLFDISIRKIQAAPDNEKQELINDLFAKNDLKDLSLYQISSIIKLFLNLEDYSQLEQFRTNLRIALENKEE